MNRYSIKSIASPQKITVKYTCEEGLPSENVLCVLYGNDGELYAGTEKGLCLIKNNKVKALNELKTNCLFGRDEYIFAGSDEQVSVIRENKIVSVHKTDFPVAGFASDCKGNIFMATRNDLYRYDNEKFVRICAFEFGSTSSLAVSPSGQVFAGCEKALLILHGKRNQWSALMPEMTNVPDSRIRDIVTDENGALWLGTDDGIHIYDGHSEWIYSDSSDIFPRCPVNRIVFSDSEKIYIATDIGLYIADAGRTSFLGKGRYLAGDKVNDVAVNNDNSEIAAASDGGLSVISFQMMTLKEKENYFTDKMPLFEREGYYISRTSSVPDKNGRHIVEVSDNDGLWTAEYLISLCYKYAVTKDDGVKALADKSVRALTSLVDVTGVKGFPARSYRRPGEHRFGDGDSEWHLTEDEKGPLEWKGETSSDELVGHFASYSAYFDYVADENDKAYISHYVKEIADHLLEHNYTLCDCDGISTTWAHFGPDDMNKDELWCWEKGLNSLEILAFLRIASHITGDNKYDNAAEELLKEHHYGMNVLLYKKFDGHTCHIDDRLAFIIIVPLLRYEKDKAFLRFLKFALRRHFEYEKCENNPYFSFVYSVFTGCHADFDKALETLEDYPLDLKAYYMDYSLRPDIEKDFSAPDYGFPVQSKKALYADERAGFNMMTNPFFINHSRDDFLLAPSEWLLSYWFGRYYGITE